MRGAYLPGAGFRARVAAAAAGVNDDPMEPPRHLDLKKDRGLSVEWADGDVSYYSIGYLRRMSPSAEQRQLREEMEKNPLTVLPSSMSNPGELRAESAELVGNYALRIIFSDGHKTGLFSWDYLRRIDPRLGDPKDAPPGASGDEESG
jgi:DUF971 family protein